MKYDIKAFLMVSSIVFALPVQSNSTNWSRFITTQSRDEVTISFRQKQLNHAWSIEWHVKNDSDQKVEPVLLTRNYVCKNGESQLLQFQTLGIFGPGDHRKGNIKDRGICPNSKIKFVEIQSEINLIELEATTAIGQP